MSDEMRDEERGEGMEKVQVIDSHTEGEPTRVVLEGMLGYTPAEVDGLAADGVVQLAD